MNVSITSANKNLVVLNNVMFIGEPGVSIIEAGFLIGYKPGASIRGNTVCNIVSTITTTHHHQCRLEITCSMLVFYIFDLDFVQILS